MKMRKPEWKSGCSHPGSPEKEKASCRKTERERQRQQRETIIIGRCSPREIAPVCECQNAETGRQVHAPQLKGRQRDFLVIDAAGRKECMKIVGFWLRNLSVLAGPRWAFPTCLSGRAESERRSSSREVLRGELLPLSILSRCRSIHRNSDSVSNPVSILTNRA
jgi:hypothetical protein